MTDSQLSLIDNAGRVHRDAMDTERAAARSMRESTSSLRRRVLDALRAAPDGLTDDEGAALLGWSDRLRFGRRRQELCMAGLAHDSGKRRLTPTGRPAAVWKATAP